MSIDTILRRLKESRDNNIIDKYQDVASEIHQKVRNSVLEYMESEGFSKSEAKHYTRIDATFQDEYLVIEVGAEVSYNGLMDLCDKLNPIVAAYDEESYFEPVDSGIISAWIPLNDELLESSDNLSMEFATDEEAYEWAEANGYEVTKIQNSDHGDKKTALICWMKKINEASQEAEYICKEIKVDSEGVMEIICYDTVEDEEFEKYIGQVESPSALKAARLLLRDWKFEVPKEIKNELIGTFGLEEYGYSIEESAEEALSVEDMRKELVQYGDYTEEEARKLPVGELMQAWTALPRDLHEESKYLSSFDKEVMRAVNDQAPSALHWKDGDQIKNTTNDAVGTFKGYIYVSTVQAYKAVIEREHDGKVEVSRYNLPSLQSDIKSGRLVNLSRSTKESKDTIVESSFEGGWGYWETPADYRGPYLPDHYFKVYTEEATGFIYPPFEADRDFFKELNHSDYIAELYHTKRGDTIDVKRFKKMRDAREWLDSTVASILSTRK